MRSLNNLHKHRRIHKVYKIRRIRSSSDILLLALTSALNRRPGFMSGEVTKLNMLRVHINDRRQRAEL